MRVFLLAAALFFWGGFPLYAQFERDYRPAPDRPPRAEKIRAGINTRLESDLGALSSKYKKDIALIYKDRAAGLVTGLEEGYFLGDTAVLAFCENVLNNIRQANPELAKMDVRLLIRRSSWPNAACYGEGTLVVNTALLRRLENESQLAFVLCHELAHYRLNHVNAAIQEHFERINSDEVRREMKKIVRSEYNTHEQALGLVKDLVLDTRRHGRRHEHAADSLGLLFLQKTSYHPAEALRCLALLDEVDQEKYNDSLQLRQLLNRESFPFRDAWLQGGTSWGETTAAEEDEAEADSLKTHPDCLTRIKALQPLVRTDARPAETATPGFAGMVNICDFELVAGEYDFQDYAASLYHSLQLLEKYPENGYLHGIVALSFYQLHEAQKRHELGKYVELPDTEHRPGFRQVLTLLHNLRLKELSLFGYHYLQPYQKLAAESEVMLYAAAAAGKAAGQETAFQSAKQAYLRQYPRGLYREALLKL